MATSKVSVPRVFVPDEQVPVSGVYRVVHNEHRPEHLVCAVAGDVFPRCRKCGISVRFKLWMDMDYLLQEWDLSGPNLALVK